jgi:hypothetical protein
VAASAVALAAVVAVFGLSDAPGEACERLHHWFVWGGVDRAPPTEVERLTVAPAGEENAVSVSGTVRYSGGERGASDRELPLRRVEVQAGGISVRIEDASRSSVANAREVCAGDAVALLASIWGWFEAGDPRPIDYRFYHFAPDEPVELELPFSITVTPVSDIGGGRFSVALGDLSAGAEHRWDELDEIWEPLSEDGRHLRIGAVMAHWRDGERYARVRLDAGCEDRVRHVQRCNSGQWRLRAYGDGVVCEALATGSAEVQGGRP